MKTKDFNGPFNHFAETVQATLTELLRHPSLQALTSSELTEKQREKLKGLLAPIAEAVVNAESMRCSKK